MKFNGKSKTEPGLAYSAHDLIRRSLNGTMPNIYSEGSYDLNEGLTYDQQEIYSSVIPDSPDLVELFNIVQDYKQKSESINDAVKRFIESRDTSDSVASGNDNKNSVGSPSDSNL